MPRRDDDDDDGVVRCVVVGLAGFVGKINFHICDFTYVMLLIQIRWGEKEREGGREEAIQFSRGQGGRRVAGGLVMMIICDVQKGGRRKTLVGRFSGDTDE